MDDHEAKSTMLLRLVESEQWQRALTLSGELLASDPDNAHFHRTCGLAALALDRHRTAKRHLEAAVARDPTDPHSHYLLGQMFTKEGRILYAKREFLKALELDPEDASYWVALGSNCLSRGDLPTARSAAGNALALDPDNASVRSLVATCQNRRDDGSTADAYAEIEALQRALQHAPESAFIHFQIGVLYLEDLADPANAEESFRAALALDPTDPDYRRYLLAALRRHDPVLRVLHSPVRLFEIFRRRAESAYHSRPRLLFALIPLAPFLLVAFFLGAMLWGLFLLAPAKFYEFLVKRELFQAAGHLPLNPKGFAGLHSWPFYLRFAIFVAFFLAFVTATLWLVTDPAMNPYLGDIAGALFFAGLIVGFILSARRPHQK